MRGVFLDSLYDEMLIDESIFFLTADIGINLVEKFETRFQDRFLNVGIAEQNLIGVAAGLAESGMKPYVYTISNFLIHRALEQIRNDLILHDLPVTLIGTSTGYDNAPLGPTHHMLEDWGIASAFPSLRIYAPFSKESAKEIFQETLTLGGVKYVRIAKGSGLQNYSTAEIDNKKKKLVLSYGSAIGFAENFSRKSQANFLPVSVLGKQSEEIFEKFCRGVEHITIVEDHFSHVGLYSYLCQWLVANQVQCSVESISPIDYSLIVGHEFSDFIEFQVD